MVFDGITLVNCDIPEISLGEWFLQNLRKLAAQNKTAFIWGDNGTEISYAEFLQNAVQVATGLKAMGLKSRDTIAVVTRNSPELFPFIIGCLFSDIVVAPSVPDFGASELKSNFLITKPNYILTRPEKVPVINEAISDLNPRPEIILLEETVFKDILAKGSDANPDTFQPADIKDPFNHVFAYMFSSGTTGKQKAIMERDYPFLKGALLGSMLFTHSTEPFYCGSQLNWISWFYHITRCTLTGRPWLFLTNTEIESVLQAIHTYKPTQGVFAPSHFYAIRNAIEKNPGRWDISSLKIALTGGDWFGSGVQKQLSEQLKWDIYQEYGSTEAGLVTSSDWNAPPVHGSGGQLIFPIKLIDINTGKEITEINKAGEIYVKPVVSGGYLGNPVSTAEAFDDDGWFKMGDLGYVTGNAHLFIVDRIKEMLKYKGIQVAPTELEDIIRLIPGVAEAAVAGKNDEVAGTLLTAFIVKKPGSNLTENDINNFMEKRDLHDAKKLRGGVIFIEALPKNSNGKLLRRKLTEILNGAN